MSRRALRVRIRPATKSEMPAIRDLIRLHPGQLVQRNLPRVSSFFVADLNGTLVGCCALQVYSKRLAEVRSLSVHPDFQDAGVASKLVEACQRGSAATGDPVFAAAAETVTGWGSETRRAPRRP